MTSIATFAKLKAAGVVPIAVGAKVWSHAEWFESIYEHLNGIDMAAKLAAHQIPWTDPSVKNTLKKYAELIKAGCCGDAQHHAPAMRLGWQRLRRCRDEGVGTGGAGRLSACGTTTAPRPPTV